MSYDVVREFERALAEYAGARYCVTTSSCSAALTIACALYAPTTVSFPRHTYCSAPMAALHAGHRISWRDEDWRGAYRLEPTTIWDSARRFRAGMYVAGQMQCVSFQASKILGLEQGGAIFHDSEKADIELRRLRFDGRYDESEGLPQRLGFHCYMSPTVAALGLQRLALLPRDNPDQVVHFPDLSALPIWP